MVPPARSSWDGCGRWLLASLPCLPCLPYAQHCQSKTHTAATTLRSSACPCHTTTCTLFGLQSRVIGACRASQPRCVQVQQAEVCCHAHQKEQDTMAHAVQHCSTHATGPSMVAPCSGEPQGAPWPGTVRGQMNAPKIMMARVKRITALCSAPGAVHYAVRYPSESVRLPVHLCGARAMSILDGSA